MYRSFKIALLLMMTLLPFSAQAADYYVDISNNTGFTIYTIYVSPGSAKAWEEDVLGSEVMINGTTRRITLTGYKSPIFDIRLVDEDGDTYTLWNVNVSTQDITATLADLDIYVDQAPEYYVDITNNTGYTIYHIYVSPGTAKLWEEDVLGSEVMINGTTRRITLTGYKSPIFDIRLVDEDGDSYTLWDVDVSTQDITATLADLDL